MGHLVDYEVGSDRAQHLAKVRVEQGEVEQPAPYVGLDGLERGAVAFQHLGAVAFVLALGGDGHTGELAAVHRKRDALARRGAHDAARLSGQEHPPVASHDVFGAIDLDGRPCLASAQLLAAVAVVAAELVHRLLVGFEAVLGAGEEDGADDAHVVFGDGVAVAVVVADLARVQAVEVGLHPTGGDELLQGLVEAQLGHGKAAAHARARPVCTHQEVAAHAVLLRCGNGRALEDDVDALLVLGAAAKARLAEHGDVAGQHGHEPVIELDAVDVHEAQLGGLFHLHVPVEVAEVDPLGLADERCRQLRDAVEEGLGVLVEHAAAALLARQAHGFDQEDVAVGRRVDGGQHAGWTCPHDDGSVMRLELQGVFLSTRQLGCGGGVRSPRSSSSWYHAQHAERHLPKHRPHCLRRRPARRPLVRHRLHPRLHLRGARHLAHRAALEAAL